MGAGIGGFTAAIALAKDGHRVQIFERHRRIFEYGTGLQLSLNAVRILFRRRMWAVLEAVAFAPAASVSRRYETGNVLGRMTQNPEFGQIYSVP